MNQMTFSDMEYSGRKKVTQKEKFLRLMNQIIPWVEWVSKIQPYYPIGKRGRPPRDHAQDVPDAELVQPV